MITFVGNAYDEFLARFKNLTNIIAKVFGHWKGIRHDMKERTGLLITDMEIHKVSQQAISKIEQSEAVEQEILTRVAKVLGVPVEAIENFSEEAVFNIISNTFHNNSHDNSSLIASAMNYQPTFNTIEKIVELYKRLLQSEKEKVELLKGKKNL